MEEKSMRNRLLVLAVLVFLLLCLKAYAYDIVVAKDGSGNYTSIQAAINAVPSNSAKRTDIYIKSGLYNTEKLIVPSNKQNVTLIGESRTKTIISYHIYDCSAGHCPVEDAALWSEDIMKTSATLTIVGDGFRAENITIQNTAGPVGQAQAITVRGDKAVFISCDIKSYIDQTRCRLVKPDGGGWNPHSRLLLFMDQRHFRESIRFAFRC
jgi:pectin methylesterase-like acyl-CoA thioesterase